MYASCGAARLRFCQRPGVLAHLRGSRSTEWDSTPLSQSSGGWLCGVSRAQYPAQIKPKVPSDGLNKKAVWF